MSESPVRKNKSQQVNPKSSYLPFVAVVLVAVILAMLILVTRDDPSGPEVFGSDLSQKVLSKARPLVAQQQYAGAIALMEAYVKSSPDDTAVRPLLAEAQMEAGLTEQAEHTVDDVLVRAPLMARALWLKALLVERRGGEAMSMFSKAAEGPDASAEMWVGFGLRLLSGGDTSQARLWLDRAREGGIEDARTLGPLGQLALNEMRYDAAEELLSKALKTAPDNARIWAMLAEAQIKAGKVAQAARTLDQAIEQHPTEIVLLLQAATVACDLKRYDQARSYLELAERAPGYSPDESRVRAIAGRISTEESQP